MSFAHPTQFKGCHHMGTRQTGRCRMENCKVGSPTEDPCTGSCRAASPAILMRRESVAHLRLFQRRPFQEMEISALTDAPVREASSADAAQGRLGVSTRGAAAERSLKNCWTIS